MALDGQELKWLEVGLLLAKYCSLEPLLKMSVVVFVWGEQQSHDYCPWGTHVSRSLERKQFEHEVYSLTGACTGGKEELPIESLTSVARLDLFELTSTKWLSGYDVHGSLTHRIGHSVVTLGDKAYTFGGELIDSIESTHHLIGDTFEISYENNVLYCTDVSPICGDGSDQNAPSAPAPAERAWHASAPVRYREPSSDPDTPHAQAMLVLGGKNSQGAMLSDLWLLILDVAGQKPRWLQLSVWYCLSCKKKSPLHLTDHHCMSIQPTGNSPLPLVFHNAVALGEGDKVVVVGGRQHLDPLTPAMNSGIHVLDLTTNTWAVITTGGDNPENCTVPRVLTARCCATALTMQLPIDEGTGIIRRIKDGDVSEKPCVPQEAIVIFGGFSEYEPALDSSTITILEPQHARIREVQVQTAGIKSYMGHASAVRPDKKGFFLFGGVAIPEYAGHGPLQQYLDLTTALDFWETPAGFPSEAEEEAQRQADANPIKTKTLSNGDVYVGEINADQTQRHGKGKCTYVNGNEYDGNWRDDLRCGQGIMRYAASEDVYAGVWEADQRHGFGIYEYHVPEAQHHSTSRQPKKYEGMWVHDQKHGAGTLTFSDGTQLVGSWANDIFDTREKGCLQGYDDGQNGVCRYEGEVCDGVPHGQGESNHEASGEVYEGNWVSGRRSGHGVATLRDGSVYRGEWRNGRRNGFGIFDDARTRARYDGKWVGGVRCGRGVCKYANGCLYEGDWLDDVRHGNGRYSFTDGSCYDGTWVNDKFCGDGSFMLCVEESDTTAQQDFSNSSVQAE
ncbi:unnamed protein product [Phytophthora lilii]|uniref:Unnamed protein product n=1 Tax=Phytophthora lilii TaxID=2077276 RepID=A0A9W6WPU8_9STRA|nr:unnamed protein product [Phytophthora lilii]